MTLAACLFLICAGMCVGGGTGAPLACNVSAIGADGRGRYRELMQRLRAAISSARELADGYEYDVDSTRITLPEVAEWMTFERLCCPFFRFQLDMEANGDVQLTLRGPEGAKAILREELPRSEAVDD